MQVDLTTPQSDFFLSTSEYTAAVAGFGSGKTQAAISRLAATKLQYPTVDIAYLAPSYSLIRDIFYPRIAEVLNELDIYHKINKSEHNVYIQSYGKIICRSMDNPGSLVGWEVGDALLDEFDTIAKIKALSVMEMISARARAKFPDGKKNQKFVSTTPEGYKATYDLFVKNKLDDSRLIQMSTYSNAHNLPPGFIEARKKQYSSQLIDAYIEGRFVNLTAGSVYPYFDRDRNRTMRVLKKGEPLDVGMDFNVGKMSAVVFAPFDGERLEIIAELIGYQDTPAIIVALKERFEGHRLTIFPDAAGKHRNTTGATITDHKLLKLAGFRVKALRASPLVKERVQSVNALFEKGFLSINTDRCPETTEALEQQAYDKHGNPDKSLDIDHPLDALGYRVCNGWLISKAALNYQKAVS